MNAPHDSPDFLSGQSGHVAGVRQTSKALLADVVADAWATARLQRPRLRRAARASRRRRVLVLAVERTDVANLLEPERRGLVVVCNAPIVEGAVMAATEAAGGSSLEQVRAVAEELSAG